MGLKIRKSKKLDGESLNVRNTDCWWKKQNKYSLWSYRTYIDIIEDKNETPLNDSEKRLETDKVTNARKEAVGESYSAFPH